MNRALNKLIITDSGFDGPPTQWERDISTTRALTQDEKLELYRYVKSKSPTPEITMVVYSERPCEHHFQASARRPVRDAS